MRESFLTQTIKFSGVRLNSYQKTPNRLTVIISLFELAHGKALVRILGVDNRRSIVRRAAEQYIS